MGKFYTEIPKDIIPWIEKQHCFWVASAPLSGQGHVNVSPKGMQDGKVFFVVDSRSCYYLDMTGSGNETISHLYEPGNQRLTILFNGFVGAPRILRLFGTGRVIERDTHEFTSLISSNPNLCMDDLLPGTRAAIYLDIHQVGTSCGYSVPFYDFKSYRRVLEDWAEKRIRSGEEGWWEDGLERYWAFKNAKSVDGLPGVVMGVERARGRGEVVEPMEKMVGGVGECYGGDGKGEGEMGVGLGGRGGVGVGVGVKDGVKGGVGLGERVVLLVIGVLVGMLAVLVMQNPGAPMGLTERVRDLG